MYIYIDFNINDMKDTTIKRYSRTHTAIQSIKITDECSELNKYTAIIVLRYKGNAKEYKVSTWSDNETEAKIKINKLRINTAFEILKYQFKI